MKKMKLLAALLFLNVGLASAVDVKVGEQVEVAGVVVEVREVGDSVVVIINGGEEQAVELNVPTDFVHPETGEVFSVKAVN